MKLEREGIDMIITSFLFITLCLLFALSGSIFFLFFSVVAGSIIVHLLFGLSGDTIATLLVLLFGVGVICAIVYSKDEEERQQPL